MLFFLVRKWTIPKQPGSLRELTITFFYMSTLCSFLCILAILSIQFLQFAILSSFIQKDFHLSFLNSSRNLSMWSKHRKEWEKTLDSKIAREFTYARQNGLLFQDVRKLPIELQAVSPDFFAAFPISFAQGHFDPSLPSIVISQETAFQLQSHVGDILEFSFLQNRESNDSLTTVKLLVTGILKAMPGDDPYLAFSPLTYFGNFLNSSLKTGILLDRIQDTQSWKHLSYQSARISMNDVFSRHYNLIFSFQWEKILLYFVLFMLLMISCVIIYISFSIVFQSYRSQWSLLKILGIRREILLEVFFIKTLFLVLAGFLSGTLLAILLFLLYFSLVHIPWIFFFSHIIQWKTLFWVFFVQILLCGISFAIPIYRHYNQSLLEELKSHD